MTDPRYDGVETLENWRKDLYQNVLEQSIDRTFALLEELVFVIKVLYVEAVEVVENIVG